jgi:hypothetical protein
MESHKAVNPHPASAGDWPGVFMRGDHALAMAAQLRRALSSGGKDRLATMYAEALALELEACFVAEMGGQKSFFPDPRGGR